MTFKELLKSKGFTVRSFAKAMGVASETVSRWANNGYRPYLAKYDEIAETLGVPIEVVEKALDREGNEKKYNSEFRRLLKKRKLTVFEFCRRLHIHPSTVYYWTSGKRHPSKRYLSQMSEMFKISVEDLNKMFIEANKITGDKEVC